MHVTPELAAATVLTPAGDPVVLGELWQAQPVVFVFLRHYG
jgi:hypothetical protein